jgi:hypothetical protein
VLFLRFLVIVALALSCGAAFADAADATATFDDNGLVTLSYGGVQFLKNPALHVSVVNFADDKGGDVPADKDHPTVSYEPSAQRISYSWPWGAVRCRYQVVGKRLNLELSVENDTAGPMSGIALDLLELEFPQRPSGMPWEKRFQIMGDNDGDITAIIADYKSGAVTLCNDDPASIVNVGFSPVAVPPHETWGMLVTSPERHKGDNPVFVAPRSRKTFHFSLRFSESGAPFKEVVGDLIEKFTAAHPFQLKWPDRRPIGMLSLASGAHGSPTNPRGWFGEPGDNFVGKNGARRFREKLMEQADKSIAILKSMGAQGMIFWDMEGEEYKNINYVGDPRMTATLAPEMEPVAAEFFERFHKAGLRTGVCIRPSHVMPGWDGKTKWAHSQMGFDMVEEMNQKIAYAKKHLGCLLFYVDTNARYFFRPDGSVDSSLLEGAEFKRVADANPDILLIPEIPRLDYYSCTAPYRELRPHAFGNHAATESRVLDFYPRAFSIINPIDGPAQQRRAEIVAGQRRGDILLFRCWFPDDQNKVFKSILDEADRKR